MSELLSAKHYNLAPYGPDRTHLLAGDIDNKKLLLPFYHWTHHSVKEMKEMLNIETYKYIHMHRDPRDLAVSMAHTVCHDQGTEINSALSAIVALPLIEIVKKSVTSIKEDCFVFTFKEMKDDIEKLIFSILSFIEYFGGTEASNDEILFVRSVIDKHSYEKISGRKKGELGALIPTGYVHRKGISGEWKKMFNAELLQSVNSNLIKEISFMGCESVEALHPFVTSPYQPINRWLVNALLSLNIKMSDLNTEPEPWVKSGNQWKLNNVSSSVLSPLLPILEHKKTFNFSDTKEVLCSMSFEAAKLSGRNSLIILQDPRDVIIDHYLNNNPTNISFEDYLTGKK